MCTNFCPRLRAVVWAFFSPEFGSVNLVTFKMDFLMLMPLNLAAVSTNLHMLRLDRDSSSLQYKCIM